VIVPTQAFWPVDRVNQSIAVTLSRDEPKEAPEFVSSRVEDETLADELR
jgi:hypothetical protein